MCRLTPSFVQYLPVSISPCRLSLAFEPLSDWSYLFREPTKTDCLGGCLEVRYKVARNAMARVLDFLDRQLVTTLHAKMDYCLLHFEADWWFFWRLMSLEWHHRVGHKDHWKWQIIEFGFEERPTESMNTVKNCGRSRTTIIPSNNWNFCRNFKGCNPRQSCSDGVEGLN